MKQILVAGALSLVALCCAATPAECDMQKFPEGWREAQSRVVWLNSFLATAEQKHGFAVASAEPFRQALAICREKRQLSDEQLPGTTGITSQMKCEAVLICARIAAIEMP